MMNVEVHQSAQKMKAPSTKRAPTEKKIYDYAQQRGERPHGSTLIPKPSTSKLWSRTWKTPGKTTGASRLMKFRQYKMKYTLTNKKWISTTWWIRESPPPLISNKQTLQKKKVNHCNRCGLSLTISSISCKLLFLASRQSRCSPNQTSNNISYDDDEEFALWKNTLLDNNNF